MRTPPPYRPPQAGRRLLADLKVISPFGAPQRSVYKIKAPDDNYGYSERHLACAADTDALVSVETSPPPPPPVPDCARLGAARVLA